MWYKEVTIARPITVEDKVVLIDLMKSWFPKTSTHSALSILREWNVGDMLPEQYWCLVAERKDLFNVVEPPDEYEEIRERFAEGTRMHKILEEAVATQDAAKALEFCNFYINNQNLGGGYA